MVQLSFKDLKSFLTTDSVSIGAHDNLHYQVRVVPVDVVSSADGGQSFTVGSGVGKPLMAIESAGILLYRGRPRQVFLIHMGGPFWASKDVAAWSIPKGVVGPNEEPLAAARQCLRPGGILVFTVERLEPAVSGGPYRLETHGRYSHSEGYVREAATGAGFMAMTSETQVR